MGHVQDLWMKRGPDGKKTVRSARYGKGKRWQARWYDEQGDEATKLFTSKDAAEAHVAAMDVEVRSGTYIDPKHGLITFREFAEGWRGDQLHYRPKTQTGTKSMLENHAYPVIGDMSMSVIRRKNVQRTITVASETLAASTIENLYAKLKTIFASAELDKVIRESPCIKIMLPENLRQRAVVLANGQVIEIHDKIPELYQAPVTACGATGVRKGELFGWTTDRMTGPRDDLTMIIDRQQGDTAGTWKATKTPRSDREVRLGRTASVEVSDHLDRFGPSRDGHVFRTTRGGEVRPGTSAHAWMLATAGIDLGPRSGWHLLRHYCAAVLIRAGISVAALSEHLGHANQQTTYNTYVHLWPDDTDRIVKSIDSHFATLFEAA